MDTGIKISVSAHAVLLAFAIFGGQLFRADEAVTVQIAEVSLITPEEFSLLLPSGPKAPEIVPELSEPVVNEDLALLNSPPPVPRPTPVTPPKPVETVEEPEPPAPEAVDLTPPTIAPLVEDQAGETKPEPPMEDATPAPSPRVADENTPTPPTDAEEAKTPESASTESDTATEKAEPTEEKAPNQSSTQIVTEAEKPKETAAPIKSVRPKPRPRDLAARKPDPKPEPKSEPETETAAEDQVANDIAAMLAAAEQENQASAAGSVGESLTEAEQKGLVLAVEACWSVPVGIQNAADLVVVLAVDLAPNGGLKSSPKLIEPATAAGQMKQAFEAARRALIACAPYDLPQEKYESWKRLEVVFNPKNMVLK